MNLYEESLISSLSSIVINDKDLEEEILQKILLYLQNNLSNYDLQELSDKCYALNTTCKGNGAGLSSGTLIDMFISSFFKDKLEEYEENREGEADMKLCGILLSLKKTTGKSPLALDWSKNKNTIIKQNFANHMIIINLKSGQWWKKPCQKNNLINENIIYNDCIKSGIYLINKNYCRDNVKLSSNNKTDKMIESLYVYKMLKNSIENDLYIELPEPDKTITFNICNAFSKQ
jgi:hypothetical protein